MEIVRYNPDASVNRSSQYNVVCRFLVSDTRFRSFMIDVVDYGVDSVSQHRIREYRLNLIVSKEYTQLSTQTQLEEVNGIKPFYLYKVSDTLYELRNCCQQALYKIVDSSYRSQSAGVCIIEGNEDESGMIDTSDSNYITEWNLSNEHFDSRGPEGKYVIRTTYFSLLSPQVFTFVSFSEITRIYKVLFDPVTRTLVVTLEGNTSYRNDEVFKMEVDGGLYRIYFSSYGSVLIVDSYGKAPITEWVENFPDEGLDPSALYHNPTLANQNYYGTFDNKPATNLIDGVTQYYCTDRTASDITGSAGLMIYYVNGNWVDAFGRTIS